MAIKIEGTILGLDVGSRNIGVARVNTFVKISEPLKHIDLKQNEAFLAVQELINAEEAVAVVVGLPRGLEGQETAQTKYCRAFADDLSSKIDIPVFLIDEAATSIEANKRIDDGLRFSQDSIAASIFLEDFVNQKDMGRFLVK